VTFVVHEERARRKQNRGTELVTEARIPCLRGLLDAIKSFVKLTVIGRMHMINKPRRLLHIDILI
jgi:hypothetical protein